MAHSAWGILTRFVHGQNRNVNRIENEWPTKIKRSEYYRAEGLRCQTKIHSQIITNPTRYNSIRMVSKADVSMCQTTYNINLAALLTFTKSQQNTQSNREPLTNNRIYRIRKSDMKMKIARSTSDRPQTFHIIFCLRFCGCHRLLCVLKEMGTEKKKKNQTKLLVYS